jgi:TrfA protein
VEHDYLVSSETEAAATKGVKSIPSLGDLHQRTKEIVERARRDEEERLETGVIQLPLWHNDKRGAPNSFLRSALFAAIQSKDRADLKKAELFSQQGITVTYTGQQLNQEDLTVWLALVDLMKKDPLGTQCHFTAYGILKHLGLGTGGSAHERLNDAILRMTACAVVIKTGRQTYMGSLIHDCLIDEQTKHYKITLNRHLTKLFGENDWTAIDWEQRKQLRQKPLCLKLHEYYSSHDKPLPISLEFLSALTGSENKQKADFKRKVKTALEELVKIGFLKSYEIDSDMVKVERVPKPHKHLPAHIY